MLGCVNPYSQWIGDKFVRISPPKQEVKDNQIVALQITNLENVERKYIVTPVKAWKLSDGFEHADLGLVSLVFMETRLKLNETTEIPLSSSLGKGRWEFWVRVQTVSDRSVAMDWYLKVKVIN